MISGAGNTRDETVTLAQIVAALSVNRDSYAVMTWLLGANVAIRDGDSPLRCIREGRIAEVAAVVRRIGDADPAEFTVERRNG